MAGEGLHASSAPQALPAHRDGVRNVHVENRGSSPVLACSRLHCSIAVLTQVGPMCLLLAQGFALLSRLSHKPRARMQEAQALQRLFSLHPAIAADDYQHLHDPCHCQQAVLLIPHRTSHSWRVSLQMEQRQVMGCCPQSPSSV